MPSEDLMTIDQVRRRCIDIGSMLNKSEDAQDLRDLIADIQTRADKTGPTDVSAIAKLARELESIDVPDEAKRPEYL